MYLKKENYKKTLDFSVDDDRVVKYLKGETLDVEDLVTPKEKGWFLVFYVGRLSAWLRKAGVPDIEKQISAGLEMAVVRSRGRNGRE